MRTDIMKSKIKERKISRDELSELAGIPIDTLNKILAGSIKNPKYTQIESIAHALGCTTDDFSDAMASSEKAIEQMTDEEVDAAIQKEGMELVDIINRLSPEKQKALRDFLQIFSQPE